MLDELRHSVFHARSITAVDHIHYAIGQGTPDYMQLITMVIDL